MLTEEERNRTDAIQENRTDEIHSRRRLRLCKKKEKKKKHQNGDLHIL